MKRGFTLIEILLFTTILSLVTLAALVYIDPVKQQIQAQNAKRKQDLDKLRSALEDWYNDKGCYPHPSEICYDDPVNACTGGAVQNRKLLSQTCHICGQDSSSPSFAPYMSSLPCDPGHPGNDYLYHVEVPAELEAQIACTDTATFDEVCLQSYRAYARFDYPNDSYIDPNSIQVGCGRDGCGPTNVPTPTPLFGYDYGISSPNVSLQMSNAYACISPIGVCDSCGCPEGEEDCINYKTCYDSQGCADKKKIYSSFASCCFSNDPSACL
jgi:type II secretory pathway pseudopilin PulG